MTRSMIAPDEQGSDAVTRNEWRKRRNALEREDRIKALSRHDIDLGDNWFLNAQDQGTGRAGDLVENVYIRRMFEMMVEWMPFLLLSSPVPGYPLHRYLPPADHPEVLRRREKFNMGEVHCLNTSGKPIPYGRTLSLAIRPFKLVPYDEKTGCHRMPCYGIRTAFDEIAPTLPKQCLLRDDEIMTGSGLMEFTTFEQRRNRLFQLVPDLKHIPGTLYSMEPNGRVWRTELSDKGPRTEVASRMYTTAEIQELDYPPKFLSVCRLIPCHFPVLMSSLKSNPSGKRYEVRSIKHPETGKLVDRHLIREHLFGIKGPIELEPDIMTIYSPDDDLMPMTEFVDITPEEGVDIVEKIWNAPEPC